LILYFYGDPGNSIDPMWVRLGDTDGKSAKVTYGDYPYENPSDINEPSWHEWQIALADFTDVNVASVNDIAIGFGDGTPRGVQDENYVVYFDDILLHRPRCLPQLRNPAASFNNDCIVDTEDLRVLVDDWLFGSGDNGLWYEYYEGTWDWLPDFDTLVPVKQGKVNNFDISLRLQGDYFGFRFAGKIRVETPGSYTFYTTSDDGSKLFIGDTLVVDNDGVHGMQERSGTIALNSGEHPITVVVFEKDGGQDLIVEYEGPGITRQVIPDEVLFRLPSVTDLHGDGTVNFKDFAVLADEWLELQLWP